MRKITLLSIILLIGFVISCSLDKKPLRVTFLNVGYGDSTLIEFPGGTVALIDAGIPEAAPMIRQYLRDRGIEKIDWAIATHPHTNHFGGFLGFNDAVPIEKVAINPDKRADEGYVEWLDSLKEKGIPVRELKTGDTIDVEDDDITIDVLHPDHLKYSVNGASLVVQLKYRWFDMVLFSDVLLKEQDMLIEKYPEIKNADVITIPHHGRDISDLFIKTFRNKKFVASTGFYEPLPLDEERLSQLDGEVYRTDHGHIVVETNGWMTDIGYEQQ